MSTSSTGLLADAVHSWRPGWSKTVRTVETWLDAVLDEINERAAEAALKEAGTGPAPGRYADVEDDHRGKRGRRGVIFEIADFGVMGDLFKLAPELKDEIAKRKS